MTPTIKEILLEDFEADLDRLPVRIETDTVIDRDMSKKLADYFGVSDRILTSAILRPSLNL